MLTLTEPDPDLWRRFESDQLSERDLVEHPVLERWGRARRLKETAAQPAMAVSSFPWSPLSAASPGRLWELVEAASLELNRRGLALLLSDHQGLIKVSHGAELLEDEQLGSEFASGRLLSEAAHGTNAIGTALAEDVAVAVIGHAHYERTWRGLCCYAAPIHDWTGRIVGALDATGPAGAADPILGILVRSLATALESAIHAQDLSRRLEDERRFPEEHPQGLRIGVLGHDLRSPLSAVRVAADLLVRHGDPFTNRLGTRIISSTLRMQRMVGELLDFTRESVGAVALARRPTDLAKLCEDVLDEFRLIHPERELTLSIKGDTRGWWDGDRLTRVIQNLVVNAFVHGRAGTAVTVLVSADAETVTLEVINEGEPIPSAFRNQLFDPFRRAGTGGQGLGLGLFIARSIVRAHQGDIWFESDAHKTTFRVELPRGQR